MSSQLDIQSPTPFEIGLLGIQDALKKVANTGLPSFGAELQLSPVGAGNIPTPMGQTAGQAANQSRVSLDEASIDKLIGRFETALQRLAG